MSCPPYFVSLVRILPALGSGLLVKQRYSARATLVSSASRSSCGRSAWDTRDRICRIQPMRDLVSFWLIAAEEEERENGDSDDAEAKLGGGGFEGGGGGDERLMEKRKLGSYVGEKMLGFGGEVCGRETLGRLVGGGDTEEEEEAPPRGKSVCACACGWGGCCLEVEGTGSGARSGTAASGEAGGL